MTIFVIAFFKYADEGQEYGFKRINFQTFTRTMDDAREWVKRNFTDEAGWYQGAVIEEKQEADYCFQGRREWWVLDPFGDLRRASEPNGYKNVVNII